MSRVVGASELALSDRDVSSRLSFSETLSSLKLRLLWLARFRTPFKAETEKWWWYSCGLSTHTHTQKWLKGTPESAEYHPSTLSPVVSIFSFPGTKSLFLFVMQSVSSFKPSLKTFFFSHPWVCSWFFIPFAKYSCLKVVKTQWREPPFCAHQSASILSETKPACVANVSNRSQAMCVYACTRLSCLLN